MESPDLKKNVNRQYYSIPTPGDVRSKLAGKSNFTILGKKNGHWQIKLDERSSKLCTFNTPWGRFCFLRLPFSIESVSEVFQQKNFGDIQGVHINNNMVIVASSDQEHSEILQRVIERKKAANVKFNRNKILLKFNTVKHMGQINISEGQGPKMMQR